MSRRSDRCVAWAIFAFVALVYSLTMCRTIYTGDDGDFETAMATGGICHPTGYPLFVLLGRAALFVFAPIFHEPAGRVNFLTALFGAGAVCLFVRFLAALAIPRGVCIAASLLLAFAPTLWQQSLSCEVYSLTALFLSGTLYLTARLERGDNLLRPLAFVYGLSLTNNLMMALLLPGFVAVVWKRIGWKPVLASAPYFLFPLALYFYLPLAANLSHSPVLWGDPGVPGRFFAHASGAQYQPLMFSQPLAEWPLRLWRYFKHSLIPEFSLGAIWLVVPGCLALWKERRAMLALTVWIFFVDVIYATNYSIVDIYVYYIPSYLCVAFWIAAGCETVGKTAKRRLRALLWPLAVLTVLFPVIVMSLHLAATDKSAAFLEEDYGKNILRSAPQNAVILTRSSVTFTLWYFKWVRGERPDVAVLDVGLLEGTVGAGDFWYLSQSRRQWPSLPSPTGLTHDQIVSGSYLRSVIGEAFRAGRPVIYVGDDLLDQREVQAGQPSLYERLKPFRRTAWGVAQRLFPSDRAPSDAALLSENAAYWESATARGVYDRALERTDPLQRYILHRYFVAHKETGLLAQRLGNRDLARQHLVAAGLIEGDAEIRAALTKLHQPE